MPLQQGKTEAAISHNVKKLESENRPKAQAVAIALKTAGVPKARDEGMVTAPNAGQPMSANKVWKGREV